MKKIMDRVYNVEKSRKRAVVDSIDDTPKKRGQPKKRVISLASRYPSIQPNGNDSAQQQHTQAISKEMEKDKPRIDVLLPLMKSTFYARRQCILDNDGSVLLKLEKFLALRMPSIVRFLMLTRCALFGVLIVRPIVLLFQLKDGLKYVCSNVLLFQLKDDLKYVCSNVA